MGTSSSKISNDRRSRLHREISTAVDLDEAPGSQFYLSLENLSVKCSELIDTSCNYILADIIVVQGKIFIARNESQNLDSEKDDQNEIVIEIDLTTDLPVLSIDKEGDDWRIVILKNDTYLIMKADNQLQAENWLKAIRFQTIMSTLKNSDEHFVELQDINNLRNFSDISNRTEQIKSDYLLPPTYTGITVPKMNIVILVVGTKGDVQPFIYFGQYLQKDGHRVRLATHAEYRDDVIKKGGLEYYPLAGDPRRLSEFMVKTKGRLVPDFLSKEEREELPEKMKMLKEICFSCWPAVSEPDPEDPEKKPFVADAIISNPVSYGHIHCAQKLRVPLHIMFPQPWYPTMCFPHPLMNLKLASAWSSKNFYSYGAFNDLMHIALGGTINQFRTEILGLPRIYRGIRIQKNFSNLLEYYDVPISHMWSPSFVPKCPDWPKHVDVVGEFRNMAATACTAYKPSDKLQSFLSTGEKPIYIGFGSMVIDDVTNLVNIIKESASNTKCRVLLQSGWTKYAEDETMISDEVIVIGAMPHDYLFTTVAGVIHHGGAGTTSAGLRAGNPTFVCPFFGDQHFWAEMVYRSGAGPKGCPINKLTVEKLSNAFTFMRDANTISKAKELGAKMSSEDGCAAGVNSFYRNLPLNKLLCDVSIFNNRKSRLATIWCVECGLKMCQEVDSFVHRAASQRYNHSRISYHPIWDEIYRTDDSEELTPNDSKDTSLLNRDDASGSETATLAETSSISTAPVYSSSSINLGRISTHGTKSKHRSSLDVITNALASISGSETTDAMSKETFSITDSDFLNLSYEEICLEKAYAQALSMASFWNTLGIDRDEKMKNEKLFSKYLLTEQQSKSVEVGFKKKFDADGPESGFNEFCWLISKPSSTCSNDCSS